MTAPTTDEPVAGYDSLNTRDLVAALSSYAQPELAAIERYERAHRKRKAVFSKLRGLRNGSRQPRERKVLSTDQVVAALRRFRARGVAPVARDAKH